VTIQTVVLIETLIFPGAEVTWSSNLGGKGTNIQEFFDSSFEDWEMKWQASFMSRPETITAWPLAYLDRERHKVNMARWNEERAREGLIVRRIRQSFFPISESIKSTGIWQPTLSVPLNTNLNLSTKTPRCGTRSFIIAQLDCDFAFFVD
jgi:hypothetical protein